MYIISIHDVSDPKAFWTGMDLPPGTEMPFALPTADGKRGVCIFRSDSVDTVRNLVDGAKAAFAKNEFYALDEGNALGLPA